MTADRTSESPLAWSADLTTPHALVWLDIPADTETSIYVTGEEKRALRWAEASVRDRLAAQQALKTLFAQQGFPSDSAECLHWRRDTLGKPYIEWSGEVAEWAADFGLDSRALHVSNTHDGAAHIVFAAYDTYLAGIGVDVVHLPRLRRPGKDAAYLYRFARQFMAEEEFAALLAAAGEDDEERLRVRIAAHFSLMEAASKACGTGLKVGVGMGRPTSLPKSSLGALRLEPEVRLLFGPEAQARLAALGATHHAAYWGANNNYLVSAALLWRQY